MPSPSNNVVVLAAAGSRKTEHIVNSALAVKGGRVLITTYTSANQREIIDRIITKVGTVPPNITVMGWFSFLIAQCAKPYQRALTGEPLFIEGLNFKGEKRRLTKKKDIHRYFFDRQANLYRNGVSEFATLLNENTKGSVVSRLEQVYSFIFIDEIQDFGGYDLEVLDFLLESKIEMMLVGDPRQCTLRTNTGSKNSKYRALGMTDWFAERTDLCPIEERTKSYRCNQEICDFADRLFPDMVSTTSMNKEITGHDGIVQITESEVHSYLAKYAPVKILRHNKSTNTLGLPGMNIGLAKGATYDRVLIFPTGPMRTFLRDGDSSKLKAPQSLYVAVTRARYSVAFVVPSAKAKDSKSN